MQKLSKFTFFLFLFLFLHINYYLLNTTVVYSQEPFPKLKLPCDEKRDVEFHSLRPYQAAHCGDANKALYCSNDLKFLETFDVTGMGNCVEQGSSGSFLCNPNFTVEPHTLFVDLDDSMFPIMGNTEEVKNSQNNGDIYDDATKVNEYASWYLSGVNNRAEYDESTDDRTVNYSGPIQKLLPKMIQEAERINTINKAIIAEPWTDPDDGKTYTTPQNHNQVVVCAKEEGLGWWGDFLNIGVTKPKPCYEAKEYRLSDWIGDLSDFNGLFNLVGTGVWNKRTPPLPWDDGTVENPTKDNPAIPFESELKYQKAYNEWRGQSCAIIPGININLCIDNPFVPNKWADLYQYIPLANTTDKKGQEYITDVQPAPAGGTQIGKFEYGTVKNAPLYFAHTQEVLESSQLLNKTFTPLDCPVDENGIRIEDEECKLLKNKKGSEFVKNNCSVVNVRTNKGDNLFPGKPEGLEVPDITYPITQAKCKEVERQHTYCNRPNKCDGSIDCCTVTETKLECIAQVYITIKTKTKTPNADEIFYETVAGTGSTFKKIFPKVQEGSPVSCIVDIPTVTNVTYDPSRSVPPQGGDLEYVGTIQYPEDGASDSPQLTFPHIGSVYEYFLKGIQTALRPKGYGEAIIDGKLCKLPEETLCKEDVPDSAVDSKYLGSFKSNFIELADRWTEDCPGPENNLAEECYNYVASEAKKSGVNPAFALTIWLNESGASNYCHGGDTTQDFGQNVEAIYMNFVEQLKGFLKMAKQKLCDGIPGFSENMHGWLSRYQSSAGVCDPSDTVATQYYYDVRDTTWLWVSNCSNGTNFGLTWPTDMSCP